MGRLEKSPPQFGHTPCKIVSTQSVQKVHSKVQIIASLASKGNDLLQCSQEGRISSILPETCIRVKQVLFLILLK